MFKWLPALLLVCSPVFGQGFVNVVRPPAAPAGGIAHDATTVYTAGTTNCNFNHTALGTPTIGLLWVLIDGNETIEAGPTWGGSAMSEVDVTTGGGGTEQKIHLYELHTPGAGLKAVAIDISTDDELTCIAQTFTGTHATDATVETDWFDAAGGACATSDAQTTITLNATSSWMVTGGIFSGNDMSPFTPANYTIRGEGGGGSDIDDYVYGDSTGDSGSLTHTTAHSSASGDECAVMSVELIVP